MAKGDVEKLFKNPEKVLLKLATPVILANGFQTLYNFMDAFWVSLLKNSQYALSGIGLVMPFAFSLIALANGIGIGTNSLISRSIGKKDKKTADKASTSGFALSIIVGIFFGLLLFILSVPLFNAISHGESSENAIKYAKILFMGAPFLFISNLLAAILRAEGDMKRSMFALAIGSILNVLLDPLFIFGFGMGIEGAALATIISRAITIYPLYFWIFKERSSYVHPSLNITRLDLKLSIEIFKVGIPASLSLLLLSLSIFLFNTLIQKVYGPLGVTVYITGSRIGSLAVLPALGIQAAVITLTGIWYGAKRHDMVKRTVIYAFKVGILMEGIIGILIFLFSRPIGSIFIHNAYMKDLLPEISRYLKITAIGYPFMPISMFSVGTFNGIGKSIYAFLITTFRVIIIAYAFALLYAILFHIGLFGVWLGMLTGTIAASFFGIFLLKVKNIL